MLTWHVCICGYASMPLCDTYVYAAMPLFYTYVYAAMPLCYTYVYAAVPFCYTYVYAAVPLCYTYVYAAMPLCYTCVSGMCMTHTYINHTCIPSLTHMCMRLCLSVTHTRMQMCLFVTHMWVRLCNARHLWHTYVWGYVWYICVCTLWHIFVWGYATWGIGWYTYVSQSDIAAYTYVSRTHRLQCNRADTEMGWLRLVGSLKF